MSDIIIVVIVIELINVFACVEDVLRYGGYQERHFRVARECFVSLFELSSNNVTGWCSKGLFLLGWNRNECTWLTSYSTRTRRLNREVCLQGARKAQSCEVIARAQCN